jgi:hypothetical protein
MESLTPLLSAIGALAVLVLLGRETIRGLVKELRLLFIELRMKHIEAQLRKLLSPNEPTSLWSIFTQFFTAFVEVTKEMIYATVSIVESLLGLLSFGRIHRMRKFKVVKRKTKHLPPSSAQLLMRFAIKPSDQEVIFGDMNEIFNIMVKQNGPGWARAWYVWHAIRSSTAQLVAKLWKWGVFAYIAEFIRKIASGA